MRDLYRDSEKAALSLLAGMLAVPAFAVALLALVFFAGRCSKPDARIEALRDTLRITDSVIVARTDTVYVRAAAATTAKAHSDSAKRLSDSLQKLVGILNDSTVHVSNRADSIHVVPLELVAELSADRRTIAAQDTTIRKQGALIAALYGRDSTQEWRIATRDKLYKLELDKAHGPRWGYGVTLGYGCGEKGCGMQGTVGLSYQAPLPSPRKLLGLILHKGN